MGILTFIIILSLLNLLPMCSGATYECEDKIILSEEVDSGPFVAYYESEFKSRGIFVDEIRIEIYSDCMKLDTVFSSSTSKIVKIDGISMRKTDPPIQIPCRSFVRVEVSGCDYIY